MAAATATDDEQSTTDKAKSFSKASVGLAQRAVSSDDTLGEIKAGAQELADSDDHGAELARDDRAQMGAKRIGSLAIGIGVVGIVLNEMSNLDLISNSTGVIDVNSIFQTAGSGLNLLVVGVIIAAAAVLLNLWSGF